MFVVIARVAVDPDRIDEFETLARRLWAATLDSEPGCHRYEYVRLPERGVYLTSMTFDDHDAFIEHQASDHHTEIAAGPMSAFIRSVELEFGESVTGAFGPTGEPSPRIAGRSVDTDPARRARYADRYPAPDFSDWER